MASSLPFSESPGENASSASCGKEKILIAGSGPAGLAARIGAREMGMEAVILERLPFSSRKLLASGGGKCNFSNMLSPEEFMEKFGRKGAFMRNALALTFREWVTHFLKTRGVETVLTDNFYCFPASGGSSAVLEAFSRSFPPVETSCEVTEILTESGRVIGVLLKDGRRLKSSQLILAAGGCAWAGLGTSAGLLLAERCGHTLIKPLPAVAPLNVREDWVKTLSGVSLDHAELLLCGKGKRPLWRTQGNLLFTHEGLSGFAALDMADAAGRMCLESGSATVFLRLFPGKTKEELAALPEKYRRNFGRRSLRTLLAEQEGLPRSLAGALSVLAGCEDTLACRLSGASAEKLVSLLRDGIPLVVDSVGPMEKAMAMSGGISLKEIDPATMESRIVKGLYFAGEIMDLAGPCGGYNIQWAISSGRLAGRSAAASAVGSAPSRKQKKGK
ncbi:MAG: aminoacetone oxidase family FAD-binding enzyme [Lentisphaeria bacterium]|nr:aminoacetone oxidase family FAD-binding enzyme [Lentisphaeria bacterium]